MGIVTEKWEGGTRAHTQTHTTPPPHTHTQNQLRALDPKAFSTNPHTFARSAPSRWKGVWVELKTHTQIRTRTQTIAPEHPGGDLEGRGKVYPERMRASHRR